MAETRVRSPIGVALVAMVLAGLVTALVLSFVLEDDGEPQASVLTLAPGPDDGTVPQQSDLQGAPAPDFAYEPLRGGSDVDFAAFRGGQPTVLNFFYKDCAPCVVEMPDLQDAYEAYGDRVRFLGLSYQESVEDGLELADRTGVTYELGRDPAGDIITAFAGIGLPTTVFISADGTIVETHTGRIRPDELQDELDGLLA
jgi:cytochrome c biogenesis protein CcmG, thiol:disulfide interchange protein DsbE